MAGANRPDETTVEEAVKLLQVELALINGSFDSLDRKAALIPPAVATLAGLFMPPDLHAAWPVTFVLAGLGIAAVAASTYFALLALRGRILSHGSNAQALAHHTHLDVTDFRQNVAVDLAQAVDAFSEATKIKQHRLEPAIKWAVVAILLLALARIVGGAFMADQNQTDQTNQPPTATQPATAQPTQQIPTQEAQPSAAADVSALQGFGPQMAAKGGLPPDLDKSVRPAVNVPPSEQQG